MKAIGVGLLIEDHREEIGAAWKRSVGEELGLGDAALAFAMVPLLRELAVSLRGGIEGSRGGAVGMRCGVLIRSSASPARLAREVKLLRRGLWDVLRLHGHPISQGERRSVDEWLDDALATSLERLERVRVRSAEEQRVRVELPLASAPAIRPSPAPRRRPPVVPPRPPPLPTAKDEDVIELEPLDGADEYSEANRGGTVH